MPLQLRPLDGDDRIFPVARRLPLQTIAVDIAPFWRRAFSARLAFDENIRNGRRNMLERADAVRLQVDDFAGVAKAARLVEDEYVAAATLVRADGCR